VEDDPLWTRSARAEAFDSIGFYHCDHLGTPQEMTDAEGNLAWQAQYKAWGEAILVVEKMRNSLRFQGQYFDHETGLHYNRFRYYDPEVGRFISKDPIRLLGGLNLFQYVITPTGWVDPLGLVGLRNTDPPLGSLSDVEARCWYLREETKICCQIDRSKSLKKQARQASILRNQARIRTRLLMQNRDKAKELNQADPNLTFKKLVVYKKKKKGLDGNAIYQDILDTSTKSRNSVNESLLDGIDCDVVLKNKGI
jgi:RHS repeat-associated protein